MTIRWYTCVVEVAYSGFIFSRQTSVNLKPLGDFDTHLEKQIDGFLFGVDMPYKDKNKQKERNKKYYKDHAEKIIQQVTEWAKNNPEKRKEIEKNYYIKNIDTVRERSKKRNKEHWQEHLIYVKKWMSENREKINKWRKIWHANNPGKFEEYRHNRRSRILGDGGKITSQEWNEIKEKYGNKCLYPGCNNTDITLDHVVPLSLGGTNTANNVQPLCGHHNKSKAQKIIDYRCPANVTE